MSFTQLLAKFLFPSRSSGIVQAEDWLELKDERELGITPHEKRYLIQL